MGVESGENIDPNLITGMEIDHMNSIEGTKDTAADKIKEL